MKKLLFLFILFSFPLLASSDPPPLLQVGGGQWQAGMPHSTYLFQLEYKGGRYWFGCLRPQASLVVPFNPSLFLGGGLALEFHIAKHLVLSPNFMPGIYVQGRGKNLGYPLEFRSAFEIAYEWTNACRLGTQFWHISNASLSKKNPGVNALTFYVAFPLYQLMK